METDIVRKSIADYLHKTNAYRQQQDGLQGKIDAVVIDGEPAKEFVKDAEGLKILDEAFTEEEYAIAIAKDNEDLLEKVNSALKSLKESGKLDEIVAKYIKSDAE